MDIVSGSMSFYLPQTQLSESALMFPCLWLPLNQQGLVVAEDVEDVCERTELLPDAACPVVVPDRHTVSLTQYEDRDWPTHSALSSYTWTEFLIYSPLRWFSVISALSGIDSHRVILNPYTRTVTSFEDVTLVQRHMSLSTESIGAQETKPESYDDAWLQAALRHIGSTAPHSCDLCGELMGETGDHKLMSVKYLHAPPDFKAMHPNIPLLLLCCRKTCKGILTPARLRPTGTHHRRHLVQPAATFPDKVYVDAIGIYASLGIHGTNTKFNVTDTTATPRYPHRRPGYRHFTSAELGCLAVIGTHGDVAKALALPTTVSDPSLSKESRGVRTETYVSLDTLSSEIRQSIVQSTVDLCTGRLFTLACERVVGGPKVGDGDQLARILSNSTEATDEYAEATVNCYLQMVSQVFTHVPYYVPHDTVFGTGSADMSRLLLHRTVYPSEDSPGIDLLIYGGRPHASMPWDIDVIVPYGQVDVDGVEHGILEHVAGVDADCVQAHVTLHYLPEGDDLADASPSFHALIWGTVFLAFQGDMPGFKAFLRLVENGSGVSISDEIRLFLCAVAYSTLIRWEDRPQGEVKNATKGVCWDPTRGRDVKAKLEEERESDGESESWGEVSPPRTRGRRISDSGVVARDKHEESESEADRDIEGESESDDESEQETESESDSDSTGEEESVGVPTRAKEAPQEPPAKRGTHSVEEYEEGEKGTERDRHTNTSTDFNMLQQAPRTLLDGAGALGKEVQRLRDMVEGHARVITTLTADMRAQLAARHNLEREAERHQRQLEESEGRRKNLSLKLSTTLHQRDQADTALKECKRVIERQEREIDALRGKAHENLLQ
ncbi:hypothetical protein KIPB_007894 [Kipferlia bialata]|uniref:Uncharacterized protein n=1 Tax=Kipferlia bialata TaxID=797122 RepID=A0A391NN90_9EUKA|nr:hypothetical protein KIPB_007894 [Kipferlia bialata]|eukprot:g7894.t1